MKQYSFLMWPQLFFLAYAMSLLVASTAEAQRHSYPRLNEPFGTFTLKGVSDYKPSTVSNSDFDRKHLILFFWSKYCAACIESLPRVQAIQDEFDDRITIIIVGDQDKDGSSYSLYRRAKKKLGLTIPYVFDSVFYKKNVPGPTPHLIWVDNGGIVRAITASEELARSNVMNFIAGKSFDFIDRSYHVENEMPRNGRYYNKPFFTDGNIGDDTDFIFRSLLSSAKQDMPFIGLPMSIEGLFKSPGYPKGLVQGCGTLKDLYRFAYTGSSVWSYGDSLYNIMDPSLEVLVQDTVPFSADYTTKRGYYCYSLSVPAKKATTQNIRSIIQRDLFHYFGYQVDIEKKCRPVWRLYVEPRAKEKLRSKRGDNSRDNFDWLHVRLTNISMKTFIEQIFAKQIINKQPIFDATGIDFNIDIDIRANLIDMKDIQRALKEIGFILREEKEELYVLTISDAIN